MRLTQYFNCIHVAGGYPVEPVDVHASRPPPRLPLREAHADRQGRARLQPRRRAGRGRDRDGPHRLRPPPGGVREPAPRSSPTSTPRRPLKHDCPMLDGAMRFARRGQPVIVTPFTLAGAMAPVTMAGAVVQSIAEALAAIALLQVIRPGVACMIGTFTSNVDMKSGAPAFGTPEYVRATQMTGQMARFYGLPLARLQRLRLQRPGRPGDVGEPELALVGGAVRASTSSTTPPAGSRAGSSPPTRSSSWTARCCSSSSATSTPPSPTPRPRRSPSTPSPPSARTATSSAPSTRKAVTPQPSTRPSSATGATTRPGPRPARPTTEQRANRIWKAILAEYEPPPMDEAIRDELADFVARRKREGGAPDRLLAACARYSGIPKDRGTSAVGPEADVTTA